MEPSALTGIGTIVVLGVGMQWLARRLRLPAILLLLGAGLLAGPALGLVDPDGIFGDSLFPVVSLAVGLLLFEGGLGLDIAELRTHGARPVVRLVSLGVVITWLVLSAVSALVFDLPDKLAVLLGALLVVSGPTVVGPLLRLSRPRPPASTILRWEGIVIDPIGATLALVVLEFVLGDDHGPIRLLATAGVGIGVGVAGAVLLVAALRRFAVPDDLERAVTVMIVVGAVVVAEAIVDEGGLFAATALGVVLANQRYVQVRRITAFSEDLGIIVLGSLFILLAARTDVDLIRSLLVPCLVLVAVAVLVVRPLVAWVCTARCGLDTPDRAFIAAMAPRGIVAAATSSLFGLRLTEAQIAGGPEITTIVFLVIVGTCLVYGLTAAPLARRLGVAMPKPEGVLLIGSQPWLLALADALCDLGVAVTVIATGRFELASRPRSWRLFTAPLVSERVDQAFDGVRTAVIGALDDEHNAVAVNRCLEDLSRHSVLVLPAARRPVEHHELPPRRGLGRLASRLSGPLPSVPAGEEAPVALGGGGGPATGPREGDEELVEVAPAATWTRRPFAHAVTQRELESAFAEHGEVRAIQIDHDGHGDAAPDAVPSGAVLLCVRHEDGRLDLAPRRATVRVGDTALVIG